MSELLQDERFNTLEKQVLNLKEFLEIIRKWAKKQTVEEASKLFDEYEIPYSKVNSIEEVVNSQVVKDRNMLVDIELSGVGKVPVVNTPFKFSKTHTGPQGPPPFIGQHNKDILLGLVGLSEEEYHTLEEKKVIWQER
jgi:crotonobetainyl-CoA:carnitine CoA-transferase CaiB-like acyl-CoA transferase